MLHQNVVRLQKYVLDMEEKALGKGFTLNPPESRAFSYLEDSMVVDDGEENDGEKDE